MQDETGTFLRRAQPVDWQRNRLALRNHECWCPRQIFTNASGCNSCCSNFTLLGSCAQASQQTHSETASNHIGPRFAELASRFQEHLASTVFNSSFLDRYSYSAIYPMFILVVYKLTNARDSRIRRCDPGDEPHHFEIFLDAVGEKIS